MTAEQAQALYDADKRGVRQLYGRLEDGAGGLCAMGVICKSEARWSFPFLYQIQISLGCPLCGALTHETYPGISILTEEDLVIHYNNDHKMTFSEIARKLGPDSV